MERDQVDFILTQWEQARPDLDSSPMGIIGRISRLSRFIDQHLKKNFTKYGLQRGEFDVLATLRRAGEPFQLTPTDLFKSLMLTSGAMTNRLDRLESRGYIERLPDPNDRRGTLVQLTPRGLEIINEALEAHVKLEHSLIAALSTTEKEEMSQLLRKLLISFENNTVKRYRKK